MRTLREVRWMFRRNGRRDVNYIKRVFYEVKNMWLYNKLFNSRFQWLANNTSVHRVGDKLHYRVFGITVHKERI